MSDWIMRIQSLPGCWFNLVVVVFWLPQNSSFRQRIVWMTRAWKVWLPRLAVYVIMMMQRILPQIHQIVARWVFLECWNIHCVVLHSIFHFSLGCYFLTRVQPIDEVQVSPVVKDHVFLHPQYGTGRRFEFDFVLIIILPNGIRKRKDTAHAPRFLPIRYWPPVAFPVADRHHDSSGTSTMEIFYYNRTDWRTIHHTHYIIWIPCTSSSPWPWFDPALYQQKSPSARSPNGHYKRTRPPP